LLGVEKEWKEMAKMRPLFETILHRKSARQAFAYAEFNTVFISAHYY
jgi:hypothetical protein